MDVFAYNFNRGAYLGNAALLSLGSGLCHCVVGSLSVYTLAFFAALALGVPLATMPPMLFALLLAVPAIFFFEGAALRAAGFPISHARGSFPAEVRLTNMFGFFKEAGDITSSFAWGMYEECKITSELLEMSPAPSGTN